MFRMTLDASILTSDACLSHLLSTSGVERCERSIHQDAAIGLQNKALGVNSL